MNYNKSSNLRAQTDYKHTHTQLKNAQEWKLCLCGNQNHNFNANSLPICSRDAPILNNAILGQYQHQCLKLNFSWEPIQIILACFIGGGEGHWVIYSPLWPRTPSNLPVQNWWNTTWSNGMGKYYIIYRYIIWGRGGANIWYYPTYPKTD